MLKCYSCDKIINKYRLDKSTCGSCREVLKIDIVYELLKNDKVYLSERNRNKYGRKRLLDDADRLFVRMAYKKYRSMDRVAHMFGVSKSLVHKIIHS